MEARRNRLTAYDPGKHISNILFIMTNIFEIYEVLIEIIIIKNI